MAMGREGKGLDGYKGEKVSFKKVEDGIWLGSDNEFYTVSRMGEMFPIRNISSKDCEALDVKWDVVKRYQNQKRTVPTQEPKQEPRQVEAVVEDPEARSSRALALAPDIVRPVVSATEAAGVWKEFQELKKAILTKDDICDIGGRCYVRKSGLRKIKTCFNISLHVVDDRRRELDCGEFEYIIRAKATAPNGTSVEAIGSCNSTEPFGLRQKRSAAKQSNVQLEQVRPEDVAYAIRSMAQTRAFNRCIADLIGGGEPSAEEIGED